MEGQATMRYPDGKVYRFYGRKPNGRGVMTLRNGARYDGEWKDKIYGSGMIIRRKRARWQDGEYKARSSAGEKKNSNKL